MKTIAALILTLTFFLSSHFAKAQNDYYPLEKGKTWIYKYTEDFNSASGSLSKIQILKKTEQINGKTYFILQTSIGEEGQFDVLQTSYLRNGENGQVLGFANIGSSKEDILIPEGPLEVGKIWKAEAEGQESTSTLIGTSEKLITPFKTFENCLVIETEMADAKIKSYFQKGKGLIASSLVLPDGEKLMQYLAE